MEPKNSLAKISSQGDGKIKMEEGFSTLLVKQEVTGQNLSTQGIRSLSDCKLLDANLAMHIKEEKEEVVMGFDESLVTSTQELDKKVKIEPEMGENLMAGIGGLKSLKREPDTEECLAVPGKGAEICFKLEEGSAVKDDQFEETMEALDLSLPKKRDRSFKGRCLWLTGDDAANESSLVMEVDEIEEIRTEPEVEEDDDSSCEFGEMQWGDMQVSSLASLSAPPDDAMAEDMLLIDIEGVPYTLTPDGTKVPQMDSEEQADQPDSALAADKDQPSSSSSSSSSSSLAPTEATHSQPSLSHSSVPSDKKLSCTASAHETSAGLQQAATAKSSPVMPNLSQLSVLPALSSLPSQPIQVIANSTSNTPILLLPSSQLQAASSSPSSSSPGEAHAGLMALSLPLALAQSAQSSPMFLVLSSLPVSSAQTAVTQLPVLDTSSGQLSQISSISSVALPLTASLPSVRSAVMASNSPVVNLLVPESQGSAVSGSNKLASPSPVPVTVSPAGASNVSSTSQSRHLESDKSDSWTPKSFREALLNSCPESRTVHPPDTQPQKPEVPATSGSSPSNPRPVSPLVTSDLSEPHSPKGHLLPKPEPEPVPISEQASDSVSSQDEQLVSSSSPTPPVSPPLVQIYSAGQQKYSPPSPTGGNRRVLYCRYCPRIFYYLSDLERHSITHSQSKPHVCSLCGKAFKRSSHLERHKHIHTGQRNFVCSICSKRFREAGELLRHQRVHTGEKPFQCSLCHMRFAERNTLRRHTKRKHQGREQEAMEADGGRGGGSGSGGTAASQALVLVQQEESAEWYSSTVPEQDSDSELDGDGDGEGD